jgi:hypothetical protein
MESPAEAVSTTSCASPPDAQFCVGVILAGQISTEEVSSKKEVYVRIVDGSKSTLLNYALDVIMLCCLFLE